MWEGGHAWLGARDVWGLGLSSTTPSFSWCLYRREAMGQRVCSDTTGRSEGKGSPGPTGGSWAQRSGVWAAQSYPPTPLTDSGAKSGSGLPCCEDPLTRDTSIQNPLLRGVGWGGGGAEGTQTSSHDPRSEGGVHLAWVFPENSPGTVVCRARAGGGGGGGAGNPERAWWLQTLPSLGLPRGLW